MSSSVKPKDFRFKGALSSYRIGGEGPISKQIIGLIIISSVIYVMIKLMGFSYFKDQLRQDLICMVLTFPIYLLYLASKNDKPDEGA